MVHRIMRTTSSDSEIVAGLEIWRQMAVTYAGSAQTRVVTLLKQIMTPSEWNPEKSSNVLQLYHHWLELISKYESPSSEKIAPSIKITLALQNVRCPLANALSLSVTEKSTWNDIHSLLINYFNNSLTTDSKEIYQFDISGKVSKEDSMNQVGKKGKGKSKKSKGQSKGKGASQESASKGKGKSKGQSKGKTKSKGKGQWTTWSGQSWSWNQNQGQGQGGKGKGKGHQVCSHCGRKGHSVDQCWWAQKTSSSGTSSDQRQAYNISAQPGDHSVAVMPTDQLRGFQDLRPLHQQPHNQPYYSQPSSSSAVSSGFASGQGQGFSGHHLRINHFTSDVTVVNGFTHSVLQCDGHSGLMKLQDQVGKDLSLPTQISPPYSHQSQGTVERFRKTLYGQVRAIKLGLAAHLGIHPDSTAARLMPWIISHAVFTINRYLIRQDGKTSYERVFNKAHSGPLVHFGERVLAHPQSTPPAQKLHLRAQPQKHYSLWLGKCVITGMHIVAHEGQVLKTRTVTRLVKDQQFNAVEFNKIILPPHESEPHYQEPQED